LARPPPPGGGGGAPPLGLHTEKEVILSFQNQFGESGSVEYVAS
jgi:hypothetical protein